MAEQALNRSLILPKLSDQNEETITDNVALVMQHCQDERFKFVMQSLVKHLHTFAREVDLTTEEWMKGIEFLTATGKICTDIRQEFILLSDVLGMSLLVDSLSNPKPEGCTPSTVLGPFHADDAEMKETGGSIVNDLAGAAGDYIWVEGKVLNSERKPIEGAILDIWETDAIGGYDNQKEDRTKADYRGLIKSASDGKYSFAATIPVPYNIPGDGPVSGMLAYSKRHIFRPAHMHFWIKANGYADLVTAVYRKGDPFEFSDAVFGVKSQLCYDFVPVTDEAQISKYGFPPKGQRTTDVYKLNVDFVLASEEEAKALKDEKRKKAEEKFKKA
ncbi:aromatic compound dioxygenase [Atractiella rhizophila]|nr:aromatic compound dioxygenase [Atractiella rhizophila]